MKIIRHLNYQRLNQERVRRQLGIAPSRPTDWLIDAVCIGLLFAAAIFFLIAL